ncbi:MAG: hypothetical protein AB4911_13070 [Oscillochloridaceae bacterium umkhey_bin13]
MECRLVGAFANKNFYSKASCSLQTVPLGIFGVALLQTLSFWLTNSIRMPAVIDATGVLLACTVAYVYSRYAWAATWWLLLWVVWMPITLGFKLWAWANGAA